LAESRFSGPQFVLSERVVRERVVRERVVRERVWGLGERDRVRAVLVRRAFGGRVLVRGILDDRVFVCRVSGRGLARPDLGWGTRRDLGWRILVQARLASGRAGPG
jgi:hypothetical protein